MTDSVPDCERDADDVSVKESVPLLLSVSLPDTVTEEDSLTVIEAVMLAV